MWKAEGRRQKAEGKVKGRKGEGKPLRATTVAPSQLLPSAFCLLTFDSSGVRQGRRGPHPRQTADGGDVPAEQEETHLGRTIESIPPEDERIQNEPAAAEG